MLTKSVSQLIENERVAVALSARSSHGRFTKTRTNIHARPFARASQSNWKRQDQKEKKTCVEVVKYERIRCKRINIFTSKKTWNKLKLVLVRALGRITHLETRVVFEQSTRSRCWFRLVFYWLCWFMNKCRIHAPSWIINSKLWVETVIIIAKTGSALNNERIQFELYFVIHVNKFAGCISDPSQ